MTLYAHWRDIPAGIWHWPNFVPAEIASRRDGSLLLIEDAVDRLQWARSRLNEPFRINSAYRDPIHNAMVGGAALSRHKFGDAFDISLAGHDRRDLFEVCMAAGFQGRGFYQTFLHVDMGRARFWFGGEISKEKWDGVAR